MEKILQINYQGRNISIEESAYEAFQQYESELKNYFLKEEGGEETFADLQYRMAEILEQKNFISTSAVDLNDINELIETIGKPSDLDDSQENEEPQVKETQQPSSEKKKLYRNKNKNEKVIAGVCSGIAHYFSIDPIAVRLAFVLFTIFNIATLFSFPLALVLYVVLWVVLEPAYIKTNLNRKLFRNPKDKVISGVCSGIAQFFGLETWTVRLVFLVPFLLSAMTSHSFLGHFGAHSFASSLTGLSVISYMILAFILPLAKSSTDYMLLKGEPINISTIQKSTSMNLVTQHSNSGLNKFLKIIAYIVIASFLIFLVPLTFGFLVGAMVSYKIAAIILFTSFNKILAILTIIFFLLLPVIAMVIWLIRRIGGYQKTNRPLRITFMGLHIFGWICLFLLVVNLLKENNSYMRSNTTKLVVNTMSDTLFVEPESPDSMYDEQRIFQLNAFDDILEQTSSTNNLRAIRIKYRQTDDTFFSAKIEHFARGANKVEAIANANAINYNVQVFGNKMYLPSRISVNNKFQYHFQNVKVTIFVPRKKVLIVSENLQKQLRHVLKTNHKTFKYRTDSKADDDSEQIIRFDNDDVDLNINLSDDVIKINEEVKETNEEAKRDLDEAQRDATQKIEEAKRDLEQSNREAQLKIDEAKRELEQSKREAQQKIDEAKRSISK